jgi:phage gp29-like protein
MEEPFCDWHVWVPTNSDTGASDCGYGLLYNVAQYEILGRNLLGNNSDAAELYGMPVRVGKTQKTSEAERGELFRALLDMGSSGAILLDAMDDLELLESKGNGQGFKIYADLEHRLESKISKLILGHADALDSTPGKLGATQGEESPAQAALTDKQTADGAFLQDVINGTLIPKLINLGFNISEGQKFTFSNNQELTEKRKKEDANNLQTATLAYTMKQAGLEMDPAYFQQRTGIPTKHSPLPSPEGGN